MRTHKLILSLGLVAVTVGSAYAAVPEYVDKAEKEARKYLEHAVPTAWHVYSDSIQTAGDSQGRWWQRFEDPMLDSLEEMGLRNNYDVLQAARRIEIAQAQLGVTRSGYFPTIGLDAGYTKGRTAGAMTGHGVPSTNTSYFSLGASLNWELDVFGKIRSQVNAGKKSVEISRAERAAVEVSLEAQIATAYIQLRVQQAELSVARQHSESQLKALKIAEARFDTGLASMLDVDQARQVYYTTIASIPRLESNINSTINTIATLVGEPAAAVRPALEPISPLPGYVQLVATGVPMDLLRRRPDVVEAEEQIGLYASQLGIAKKDWLPTLALQGRVGVDAHRAGDLFKSNSFAYSVAPTLSWTLFDGLSRKYNIIGARRQMENAIDNYNYTVLTAVNEVDNALSTYFSTLRYIESLENVVAASENYDRLSLDNYKQGLSPYINVADAQMSYLENINTLIVAKGDALTSLIDLYKALGGGWELD